MNAGTCKALTVHYGPAWDKNRQPGATLTACESSEPDNTMSSHKPWVTCSKCKQTLAYEGALLAGHSTKQQA